MKKNKKFFTTQMVIALVAILFASTWSWAENYTSEDSKCPYHFDNDFTSSIENYSKQMDAVSFQGYDFIFFTVYSDIADPIEYSGFDYNEHLFWYAYDTDYYGHVDINNSKNLDFRIKACVFSDILYIFYTTSYSGDTGHPNTNIYYRTCQKVEDEKGDISFEFSDEKSIATELTNAVTILYAGGMNGKLYLHFSSANNWYFTSSDDGLTFDEETYAYNESEGIYGPGGTVFPVVNAEGEIEERMMVAYFPEDKSYLYYFFFNGVEIYGMNGVSLYDYDWNQIDRPGAVRLYAGGAEGYDNSHFSIQAFISAPKDGTDESWSKMYHREFIPEGTGVYAGVAGSWSPSWTILSNDYHDEMYIPPDYSSDQRWAIIPSYTTDENNNSQNLLRIWYAKDTNLEYEFPHYFDKMRFRYSTYKSDFAEYVQTKTKQPYEIPSDAFNLFTVVGIIEGTPPFPMNNGDLGTDATNTSAVVIGTDTNTDISTAYNIGGSIGLSAGVPSFGVKVSGGLKYNYTHTTAYSATVKDTFKTYLNDPPGDHGWVLFFRPEIIADQYLLKSYDRNTLTYKGDTSGKEIYFYVINYGEKSDIKPMAYYLDSPSYPIGGDTYPEIFDGMRERPLSSDFNGWLSVNDEYTSSDQPFGYEMLPIYPTLSCTQSDETIEAFSIADTTGDTWSTSASVTINATYLGFGAEGSINFSYDWSSKTTITDNLEFRLNIPECCDTRDPDCTTPCIAAGVDELPVLLTPAEDETGYDAPWISTDIRAYRKPKPWCLSYLVYTTTGNAYDLEQLTLNKASATLHLDQKKPNRDRMEAKLALHGLAKDFSLQESASLHLRIGNYVVNSDHNPILSRDLKDKKLVLEFTETANPDASIRVTLSHDKAKSMLHIDVKGKRLDQSRIAPTLLANESIGNETSTIPFVFFLDGNHAARGELSAHVTVNKQTVVCQLQGGQ